MPEAIGITSLIMTMATLKLLVNKGMISRQEIIEAVDGATLILEELGLAGTPQGAAVHANLEAMLKVVSSDVPRAR